MEEKNTVSVKIMGKAFNVACPADKVSDLHEAAAYLDKKFNETHDKDKIINIDDLMMFSLNVVHDYLILEKQNTSYVKDIGGEINNLQNMIAEALSTETND